MFITLKTSENILEDFFRVRNSRNRTTLLNINEHFSSQGSEEANNNKLEVYFYRYIGFTTKDEYIRDLDKINNKLCELGASAIRFNNKIPQPYNTALTDKVTNILGNLSEIDIRNERGSAILTSAGIFDISKNEILNTNFKNAFYTVMKLYAMNEPIPTLSIEKNFIIKLVLWANEFIPKLMNAKTEEMPPKVLYYGNVKKHEVYFLILLAQIGCDVLYINSENEGDYLKVDKLGTFSRLKEFTTKDKIDYEFKEIKIGTPKTASMPINNNMVFSGNLGDKNRVKDNAMVTLREATDIYEDILFPLTKRVGFVSLPSPILPVYFYRCVGIDGEDVNSEEEYYNKIFSLDKKLTNSGIGYVKFINSIPMPLNDEIDGVVERFKNCFVGNNGTDKNSIISSILGMGIIAGQIDPLFNKLVNTGFDKVVKLYLSKEPGINLGRFQNFIYKLVVWINRYHKSLISSNNFTESPKILYYGDIKIHEIYFLIFLSNIGCDILYLTSDELKDKPFVEIDKQEEFTRLTVYEKTLPMREFPDKEIVIRKATTAFNASQEIENIIYNTEAGLFRPWQFEDYITRPITLKTTYDELKILWKEDSKIRPEFRVENGAVYVPNLFAKISGTLENLEAYWNDYKYFAKQPNTLELDEVPFTKVSFTRQEMYSMAFLLDSKGFVNKTALETSNYYKFGYLRNSLQNLLIDKLNELLTCNDFKKPIDNNFRLLILMTIVTLDEKILKLIETFDYPTSVPKLVVYNSTKEPFSDEDTIILAYLNSIGFDIVIFTPTNYNTIEQKLNEEIFDKFQLPSIQYDLQLSTSVNNGKSKSIFSRMFGI